MKSTNSSQLTAICTSIVLLVVVWISFKAHGEEMPAKLNQKVTVSWNRDGYAKRLEFLSPDKVVAQTFITSNKTQVTLVLKQVWRTNYCRARNCDAAGHVSSATETQFVVN